MDFPDWIPARSFTPSKLSGLIWRTLSLFAPSAARRYLDHLICERVRRARGKRAAGGGPFTLLGAFELNIGIARAAQICAPAWKRRDVPVHPMDCSAVLRPMPGPPQPRPAAPAGGTMVFCVNPPKWCRTAQPLRPAASAAARRLVGYWWWELDRVPRAWLPWAALMDEIWVSSRFIQETFSRALPGKTIRYVQLPVPEPMAAPLGRVDFGLPAEPFTVLAPFDLSSHWARKNPMGAIAAFRRAFPSAIEAQLVLKVSGADQNPDQLERLRGLTAEMPNVRIIDRDLSPRRPGGAHPLRRCPALAAPVGRPRPLHRGGDVARHASRRDRLVRRDGYAGCRTMPCWSGSARCRCARPTTRRCRPAPNGRIRTSAMLRNV